MRLDALRNRMHDMLRDPLSPPDPSEVDAAFDEAEKARSFVVLLVDCGDWRGESYARGPFASEDDAHAWAKAQGREDGEDVHREDGDEEYLVREVIAP